MNPMAPDRSSPKAAAAPRRRLICLLTTLAALVALPCAALAAGADFSFPGIDVYVKGDGGNQQVASAIKIAVLLTLLSVLPSLVIALTAFTRIIVVLSMLRHAIGMQETPPNMVLIGLALLLTVFTMSPVIGKINDEAFEPFMNGRISLEQAMQKGVVPLREFMVRQTREQDLQLMVEVSHDEPPATLEQIKMTHLIPAFILSELKTAYQIGFVIFLPFLVIDLVVSSLLMSLGMLMVPPVSISLPLKILMFVLIDGWNLVVRSLLASFH